MQNKCAVDVKRFQDFCANIWLGQMWSLCNEARIFYKQQWVLFVIKNASTFCNKVIDIT